MGNTGGKSEDGGKVASMAENVGSHMSLRASKTSKTKEVNYDAVKEDIKAAMGSDWYDYGSYAPPLIRLGWHTSATFREADGTGGSNGGTMRFSPEKDDPENKGLEVAREFLGKIKKKHPGISYGDLWILAAYTALEETDGPVIEFSPGRVDRKAKHAMKPGRLPNPETGLLEGLDEEGRINGWENLAQHMRDVFHGMGFTDREMVALICGGHNYGKCHTDRSGYSGAWIEDPLKFSTEYASDLLGDEWMYVEHDTAVEGEPIPEETRPIPGKRQFMSKWSPSDEKGKLDDIEAAAAANFPPGRYKVMDDWINVRRTHSPDSEKIDQPREGTIFNVLSIREFGKGVRGQLDVGGWASIVSSSGEPLMERTGDLSLEAGTYRVLPGASEYIKGVFSKKKVDFDDFKVESDDSGTVTISGHVKDSEDEWLNLVNDNVGALFERIVPGFNETPRKAIEKGGILDVNYQMMLPSDMVLRWDPKLRPHVAEFAEDLELLKKEFGAAYKKLTELGVPACPAMKQTSD